MMYANLFKLKSDECDRLPKALYTTSSAAEEKGSVFVFVISPPAHGDRNVSQTLWLTEDGSTPTSLRD